MASQGFNVVQDFVHPQYLATISVTHGFPRNDLRASRSGCRNHRFSMAHGSGGGWSKPFWIPFWLGLVSPPIFEPIFPWLDWDELTGGSIWLSIWIFTHGHMAPRLPKENRPLDLSVSLWSRKDGKTPKDVQLQARPQKMTLEDEPFFFWVLWAEPGNHLRFGLL